MKTQISQINHAAFLLFSLLVLTLSFLFSSLQSNITYAQLSDSQIEDLANKDPSCAGMAGNAKEACVQGFVEGYKGINPEKRCSGISGTYVGNCSTGYYKGVAAKKSQPTEKDPLADMGKVCGDLKGKEKEACETGYKGRADGEKAADACKSYSGTHQNICIAGWKRKGTGSTTPVKGPEQTDPQSEEPQDKKTNEEEEEEVECEDGAGVLGWIICPIVTSATDFTESVFKDFVEPLLENVPVGNKADDGAFLAWQQFRIIGNILLIGSMLAIVYSQTRGGGN